VIKEFLLFRHGQTDWNKEGRLQGSQNSVLNEVGKEQAKKLADSLVFEGLEVIVSSDRLRAKETGDVVAKKLNIPIYFTKNLSEACLGYLEGKFLSELDQHIDPTLWENWLSTDSIYDDLKFDGGESKKEVKERAFNYLESFISEFPSLNKIGVSSHGFLIKLLILDIYKEKLPFFELKNGSLVHLLFNSETKEWSLGKTYDSFTIPIFDKK
jgi:probable phosphoglycerate mutase